MKKLIPVFLLFVLCSASTCEDDYLNQPEAPPNTWNFAVQQRDDWYAHGDPLISLGCQRQLILLYVSYESQAMMQSHPACAAGDAQLYGCLDGNTIVVASSIQGTRRVRYVMAHEMRHWLAGCSMGTPDGNHAIDAVWFPYEGVDIRQ
jgi:hypothetical protein